jgi:hypothetical protein
VKIVVRNADLSKDCHELIAFLYDNLTRGSNSARFDWLYADSPFGEARAWIAADSVSGRTVGVAAAFPRQFWFETKERRVWVLGDFCISREARSLGPAIQLQRVCLAALNGDPWYDIPNKRMMAIYKRLGTFEFLEQVRYAKLLRIDQKVESFVPGNFIGSAIRLAGNTFLQLRSRPHIAKGVELSLLDGPFTGEFDDLSVRVRGNHIQGIRSSEFLNWRFRQNPFQKFVVAVAKRQSELVGYAVVTLQEGNGTIFDLNALEEEATLPSLLAYVEDILLQEGAHTISVPTPDGSRFHKYLRSAGFYPRERSPMVIHNATAPSIIWRIQPADRDS